MKPRCKICGNQVQTLMDTQFDVDYFLCLNCEYLFQDETTCLSSEEEKQIYLSHENSADNVGYVNRFREMIETYLLPENPTNLNVLDFGSGPEPVLADLLKSYGFSVDIFDPYFAPDQGYRHRTYDIITLTEVVEHLKDPLSELAALVHLLKLGGRLAIMTQFHPMNEREFLTWWYRRDPTHIGFFRTKTFGIIANQLSLKIAECDNQSFCLLKK